jgi:hypothetical protein
LKSRGIGHLINKNAAATKLRVQIPEPKGVENDAPRDKNEAKAPVTSRETFSMDFLSQVALPLASPARASSMFP